MSSQSTSFYEMASIPCAHPDHNNSLEDGHALRTVDGKVVSNGIIVNGKCIPNSSQRIFAISGFNPVRYSGSYTSTANNAHTAKAATSQRL
jgi:hypothetical protein